MIRNIITGIIGPTRDVHRGIPGRCAGPGSIVITGITPRESNPCPDPDDSGSLSPLVADFLAELAHANRSRHTCRAYASDLAQFSAFYRGPSAASPPR